MGLIANILSYAKINRNKVEVSDVAVKAGGGYNLTAEDFAPIDKHPLKTDYAFIVEDSGTGRHVLLGYLDPINKSEANAGEEGIKGRSSDGKIVCRVFVRNDGSVEINNNSGSLTLEPNGVFNINGVTIDVQGNITTPQKVTAMSVTAQNVSASQSMSGGGKEIIGHTHPAANPPGNTGVNN